VSRARRKPWEEWSRSEEDEEGGMVAARGREATLEKRERERETLRHKDRDRVRDREGRRE
jgi:hypothetical protein